MLDHQPSELEAADRAGYDLLLSGHTHAGQIWPTGLISQAAGIVEWNYGYRKLDHLQVIVSSGIGGWGYPIQDQPPLRIRDHFRGGKQDRVTRGGMFGK